jgi:hypothetical protein
VFIDWAMTARGECSAALDALLFLPRRAFSRAASLAEFEYQGSPHETEKLVR